MTRPYVTIDISKIEHNARTIVALCREHGIDVTGVTKGTCGQPEVAAAMLRGGVTMVGESRFANVRRLEDAGIDAPCMLLRVPPLSQVEEVVESTDVSLNSELAVLESLSRAARRHGRVHDVIVMVDLGDLREGVWPDDLVPFVMEAAKLDGIRVAGLGANLTCFGGVVPTEENMNQLVAYAEEAERSAGFGFRWISGGNSSALELIAAGRMPRRVNQVRIGEAILLGHETIHRRPWPNTYQDAFVLHAEILELKKKPSLPIGERTLDAFGNEPASGTAGTVKRAILNLGRADVHVAGLRPLDPRLKILGASSDYVIVDVTNAAPGIGIGGELSFGVDYAALLAAMTSPYVDKRPLGELADIGRGVS